MDGRSQVGLSDFAPMERETGEGKSSLSGRPKVEDKNKFPSSNVPKTKRRAMGKPMMTPEKIRKQADDLQIRVYGELVQNMDKRTRELLEIFSGLCFVSSAAYFSPERLNDSENQKRVLDILKSSAKALKVIAGG